MAWLSLLGTAVQVGSQIDEGVKSQRSFDQQADVLLRQGVRDKAAGVQEEKDFRRREKQLLATGTVATAKSGIEMSGSPLLVAVDMAREIEEQAMRIKQGTELQHRRNLEQVGIVRKSGAQALTAAYTRAGGSLLQGIGSAYGRTSAGGGSSRQANPTRLNGPGRTIDASGNSVTVA